MILYWIRTCNIKIKLLHKFVAEIIKTGNEQSGILRLSLFINLNRVLSMIWVLMWDDVRWCEVMWGNVRWCEVMWGNVR